jgi:hypothetical protein
VVDTVHGHVIEDPYRWLEDFESKEAQAWIETQQDYVREVLNANPDRDALRARLDDLFQIPGLGAMSKMGERASIQTLLGKRPASAWTGGSRRRTGGCWPTVSPRREANPAFCT